MAGPRQQPRSDRQIALRPAAGGVETPRYERDSHRLNPMAGRDSRFERENTLTPLNREFEPGLETKSPSNLLQSQLEATVQFFSIVGLASVSIFTLHFQCAICPGTTPLDRGSSHTYGPRRVFQRVGTDVFDVLL
jgi:hypothetical protein